MAVKKNYTETEIIDIFGLTRIGNAKNAAMLRWTTVDAPVFTESQSVLFEKKLEQAEKYIIGWNEEKLKMQFITYILYLAELEDTDKYILLYEKPLKHEINGIPLSVQTDFMIATGHYDIYKKPYFHFQEYKPEKNPSGDSMSQLLQAMMIAQAKNNDGNLLYGCEIIGKNWNFVLLEGTTYYISKTYNSTERQDLLDIIAILRKFKHILETELILS